MVCCYQKCLYSCFSQVSGCKISMFWRESTVCEWKSEEVSFESTYVCKGKNVFKVTKGIKIS